MFGFFKRKKQQKNESADKPVPQVDSDESVEVSEPEHSVVPQQEEPTAPGIHDSQELASSAPQVPDVEEDDSAAGDSFADKPGDVSPTGVDLQEDNVTEPYQDESSAPLQVNRETARHSSDVELVPDVTSEPVGEEQPAVPAIQESEESLEPDEPIDVEKVRDSTVESSVEPSVTEFEAENKQEPELQSEAEAKPEKGGWFSRIRKGLSKTRNNLTGGLATLFLGQKEIDDALIEDLETQLLVADIGVEATTDIIDRLTARVSRKELSSAQALYAALQEELTAILEQVEKPLVLPPKGQGPFVILVIGVNGVGKTTTIGKLARRFKSEGRSVMLAAGDTFRAAAVEQLKVWGERNDVAVVAQHTGADSASVIYDALSAARSRKVDVLIADTAGRLHNKSHLMEELKKVQRVMAKLDANAPHEVMLVVDAGTGQNAISQAETFGESIPVTGIALTKLDGTAKGGVIFALAKQLGIPIRFIGVGESLEDLRPFEAKPFTDALFDQRSR